MKISRRKFLEVLGVFGGMFLFTPGALFPLKARPLRPPGAISEDDFMVKCIRCLKCGEVCPTNAIRFGSRQIGQYSETPILADLRTNPCNLCMECTQVCPSGALTPIRPRIPEIIEKVQIGTAEIDRGKCYITTGQRRACYLCVGACPLNAATVMGPMKWPVIRGDLCAGCGLCQQICPPAAITVRGVT